MIVFYPQNNFSENSDLYKSKPIVILKSKK